MSEGSSVCTPCVEVTGGSHQEGNSSAELLDRMTVSHSHLKEGLSDPEATGLALAGDDNFSGLEMVEEETACSER